MFKLEGLWTGVGEGVREFLLREIIALLVMEPTQTLHKKKWTKNIAFYLFTISMKVILH